MFEVGDEVLGSFEAGGDAHEVARDGRLLQVLRVELDVAGVGDVSNQGAHVADVGVVGEHVQAGHQCSELVGVALELEGQQAARA